MSLWFMRAVEEQRRCVLRFRFYKTLTGWEGGKKDAAEL